MLKKLMAFRLKPGTDPDEFWEHWQKVHGAQYAKRCGTYLQKYVVNRVIETTKGEPIFWGLVETWWNNKEEYAKCEESPEAKAAKSSGDPYFGEHIEGAFSGWLEEKQIK